MTDEELAAIEARANAASPLPWEVQRKRVHDRGHDLVYRTIEGAALGHNHPHDTPGGVRAEADCAFVVAARTDVPALVAEVRKLRLLIPPNPPP